MNDFIPVNTPLLTGNEKKYLNECIDTGWISSEGPFIKQLETDFATRMGRKYGVAVCNGSVALEVALKALHIQPGDEVIMPAFTIISCAFAILRMGAKPVLVDSRPDTWNMDVSQIEAKITDKTRVIMVVHIYGLPCEMDAILAIAKKHQLKIIEDAAEMHGQTYNDIPCGSFGEISTFSFYPNKLITTGEGGMLVMDDAQMLESCQLSRNLAFHPKQRYLHEDMGWNFRMSNLQAAVGVAQLERLTESIQRKREMGRFYTQKFQQLRCQLPIEETSYARNIYWVYGLVHQGKTPAQVLMAALHAEGIGTRAFFYPMHQQPVLQKMGLFKGEQYPVAEHLARFGFYIPSGLALTPSQMDVVVQKVRKVCDSHD